ncbi:MAG: rffE [Bacillales bacterium]|jgi:UDP-N-acetylglucosamine 2-epimerase (non-hydrolysing)|nr:rffE [Bacillales bacterium]
MLVFGTRPDAIKMAPLVKELKKRNTFQILVCVTGQHQEMLYQVLDRYGISPDYDLSVMKENQSLFDITTGILDRLKIVVEEEKPDLVLVQGDTSTAFATALTCFYMKTPIGHIEAGLRTNNVLLPFPEEFNRQAVGLVSKYHFAPTELAKENLLNEGKEETSICVTGNTSIDTLKANLLSDYNHPIIDWADGNRLVLLTAHRRENMGAPFKNMFYAIKRVLDEFDDIKIVFPIHPNPIVRETAFSIFKKSSRLKIIEPLEVHDFHNIMSKSYLILTDSGGIQEEAAFLGKPTIVLRSATERSEGIDAGVLKLSGIEEEEIYNAIKTLLGSNVEYEKMLKPSIIFGDGLASKKIADFLEINYSD